MAKILLDYVFPITVITPTPAASTAFLKQVCVVAKPKTGQTGNVGNIYPCTTMAQVLARTDNTEAQQLFDAGMSKVLVLLATDLQLATYLAAHVSEFYTLLVTSDYDDDDIAGVKASYHPEDVTFRAKVPGTGGNAITVTVVDNQTGNLAVVTVVGSAITIGIDDGTTTATTVAAAVTAHEAASALVDAIVDSGHGSDTQAAHTVVSLSGGENPLAVGTYPGVIGISSATDAVLNAQAAMTNRCAFKVNPTNGAKNLFFAFGKLLSNQSNWVNQQYIEMPFDEAITDLGAAQSLFAANVSFVLHDDEFGNRLGFFVAGGRAIAAPYILKNLMIDLQSRALQWISGTTPAFTIKEAALLQMRLQEDVINKKYIATRLVSAGTIEILLIQDNFVADGDIEVAQPKALWRVFSEMRQTV